MASYNARLVEVRQRVFTILEDFADPAKQRVFNNAELPFDKPEDRELACRTQIYFFRAVFANLNRTPALNFGLRSPLEGHL